MRRISAARCRCRPRSRTSCARAHTTATSARSASACGRGATRCSRAWRASCPRARAGARPRAASSSGSSCPRASTRGRSTPTRCARVCSSRPASSSSATDARREACACQSARPTRPPSARRRSGSARWCASASRRSPRGAGARRSRYESRTPARATRRSEMSPKREAKGREGATSWEIKVGLAEMLKGGVIMDVTTPEQAKIAEEAGAAAVMALERVPADIRKEGGVARMCSIEVIEGIQRSVSIPVMAKVRIGHFLEARVLESLGVDFIDESEVLTPADEEHHVAKHDFRSPFVCGARNLGEALRRIGEGAAMIRTKGEAGSGNIVEAVRHLRAVTGEIRALAALRSEEVAARAKELQAPYELVKVVARDGKLPVPNFAAGGIATPADAALCMALGAEAVFVGSGIFKSQDPAARARAVVRATTHWDDPDEVLAASRGLAAAMPGIEMEKLAEHERLANRGW